MLEIEGWILDEQIQIAVINIRDFAAEIEAESLRYGLGAVGEAAPDLEETRGLLLLLLLDAAHEELVAVVDVADKKVVQLGHLAIQVAHLEESDQVDQDFDHLLLVVVLDHVLLFEHRTAEVVLVEQHVGDVVEDFPHEHVFGVDVLDFDEDFLEANALLDLVRVQELFGLLELDECVFQLGLVVLVVGLYGQLLLQVLVALDLKDVLVDIEGVEDLEIVLEGFHLDDLAGLFRLGLAHFSVSQR